MAKQHRYRTWEPTDEDWALAGRFLDWMQIWNAGKKGPNRLALSCRASMSAKYQRPVERSGKQYTLTSKGFREWAPKAERAKGAADRMMQGHPPDSDWYMQQVINYAFETPAPLVVFPGTAGLCAIDVDSETLTEYRKNWPSEFWLHSTSCFTVDQDPRRREKGHVFYQALQDYSGAKVDKFLQAFTAPTADKLPITQSGQLATLDGVTHRFDYCQHNRPLFIPPHQIARFFTLLMILETSQPPVFPYSLISLQATLGFTHNVLLQGTFCEHVNSRDGISSHSAAVWRKVILELGYDRSFEDLTERLTSRDAGARFTNTPVGRVAPFDSTGLRHIVETEGWKLRFSMRANEAEIYQPAVIAESTRSLRDRFREADGAAPGPVPGFLMAGHDPDWTLVGSEHGSLWLRSQLRKNWRRSDRKNEPEYETKPQWPMVEEWFGTIAIDMGGYYSPFAELLHNYADLDTSLPELKPPFDEPCFPEYFLDFPTCLPPLCTLGLRRALRAAWARVSYTWLWRQIHPANQEFRCPYLISFVGPTGEGKSRFWFYLGYGHYWSKVVISSPPKEMGENVQQSVVHEVAELHEKFEGRSRSHRESLRGQAKDNIESTRFRFRLSGAHGFAKDYYLTGIFGGSSQQYLRIPSTDGLARRIFQFPVRRHPEISPDFVEWDDRWQEYFPREVSRLFKVGPPSRVVDLTAYETRIAKLCLEAPNFIELTGEKSDEPDHGWVPVADEFDDPIV